MPGDATIGEFSRRQLPPKRYYGEPPEWEVIDARGAVLGLLETVWLGGGKRARVFYKAMALYPGGDRAEVTTTPDPDRAFAELARYLADPDAFELGRFQSRPRA